MIHNWEYLDAKLNDLDLALCEQINGTSVIAPVALRLVSVVIL